MGNVPSAVREDFVDFAMRGPTPLVATKPNVPMHQEPEDPNRPDDTDNFREYITYMSDYNRCNRHSMERFMKEVNRCLSIIKRSHANCIWIHDFAKEHIENFEFADSDMATAEFYDVDGTAFRVSEMPAGDELTNAIRNLCDQIKCFNRDVTIPHDIDVVKITTLFMNMCLKHESIHCKH